ncbi:flavin-containing monooxygenase 5, partial [Caerostris extrusa]
VYLSTRSGAHVMKRVGFKGYPYDYILLRPYLYRLIDIFPVDFVSWLLNHSTWMPSLITDYTQSCLTIMFLSKDPIINDHIGSKLLAGQITQKYDIERFTENGVILKEIMLPPKLMLLSSQLGTHGNFHSLKKAIFPAAELQCRWATQVLAGKCSLPSEKEMMVDIQDRYQINSSRYTPSEKNSIRVDYIQFCDDLASQFGAKPSLLKLFH